MANKFALLPAYGERGGFYGYFTVVVTVTLLLAELGSATVLLVLAVLLTVPEDLVRTVMVMLALAPFAILPKAQLTVVVPLQVPCDVAADRKVTLDGSVSVSVTLLAVLDPLFFTTMPYVSLANFLTGSGESVMAIAKSALGVGGVGGGAGGRGSVTAGLR